MNKLKKSRYILPALLLLTIAASSITIYFIRISSLSIITRVILLVFLNFNIIALLTLIFFVIKAMIKLYLERRQKVLGYKFKTKIMVVFVILTSIPSLLLFFGASGLITNYIDRWFTPQFRQPIESTLEIAKALYELEREKTLNAARSIAATGVIPPGHKAIRLKKMPANPSELVTEAFSGKEGTEVVSGRNGDTVRAVVPEFSGHRPSGVVIVESHIPKEITRNVEKIKNAYEDYIKLEAWKQPLKFNYLLILGFFTLLVIFTALWVSLRIARGITDPIQRLAQATRDVASGNLGVNVAITRDDEIGLLISSFNHMVKELREGKDSLQAAYAESDRRRLSMENILENIQSGVISLDVDGRATVINKAACSILNIKPDKVIGINYREILSGIQSDELREFVRGMRLKSLRSVEKADVRANINGRRVMLRISVMGLQHGTDYLGILVVFDDLTDVIKAQRALTWQEVARRIAHEIKNPLTPIKLSTERMLKKWEQKDADFAPIFERSAKTIIREVDSLKRLADEFSRFGKMPEIIKTPTDLAVIIDEVINLYRDYKGINIRVSIPADLPPVDMDGEQFKRILINLFNNAIQAFQTLNGTGNIEVTIESDMPKNSISISVADDGPGIEEEDKEKLFLPYFSTRHGGTGLGLAIANRIVMELRGYLRVKDNEPRGSVFTIELPIKEE